MTIKVKSNYQKVTYVNVGEGVVIFEFKSKIVLDGEKFKIKGNATIQVLENDWNDADNKKIEECTEILWTSYESSPKVRVSYDYNEEDNEICKFLGESAAESAYNIISEAKRR